MLSWSLSARLSTHFIAATITFDCSVSCFLLSLLFISHTVCKSFSFPRFYPRIGMPLWLPRPHQKQARRPRSRPPRPLAMLRPLSARHSLRALGTPAQSLASTDRGFWSPTAIAVAIIAIVTATLTGTVEIMTGFYQTVSMASMERWKCDVLEGCGVLEVRRGRWGGGEPIKQRIR